MESHCRICSRTEPFESMPLDARLEAPPETIFNMFTYCTQLEVSPDDLLPQKICSGCLKDLTGAYELKRLCLQSDALFRQMLQQDSHDEEPEPMPVSSETDTFLPSEINKQPAQSNQQTTTYQCCFESCNRQTTDFIELKEHARREHKSTRHGNELRRGTDRRFVCAICLNGFGDPLQWNIHRALLRGVQRLYECSRCRGTFHTENDLAVHEAVEECRQQEEDAEDGDMDEDDAFVQKDLIQRILNAKRTGGLVRIGKEESDIVLRKKAAFLERLHRKEMKHSNKRVKLFYCCEACKFRSEISDDVLTHLDIGVCLEGFYMALGFSVKVLRCVLLFDCESCDYRTDSTSTLKVHHRRRNHSGMRKSIITRQVVTKEYPCENCGKILTACNNRSKHRRTCPYVADNTISNELRKPLSTQDHDQGNSREPQEIKYDEASNESPNSQEQESEPHSSDEMTKKRSPNDKLICTICNYATYQQSNLDHHLKTCFLENQPKQSKERLFECTRCYESFPTEEKLATHEAVGGCRQYEEDEEKNRLALIRRILTAKATNSLVRISKEEHDNVLKNKAAFLERLHRNELKHCSKQRVKLFYVCEACTYRVQVRYAIEAHMRNGTCGQGFYMALGFCAVELRCIQLFECEMCDLRAECLNNIKVHQRRRNHSGIRTTRATRPVVTREYPCSRCGKDMKGSNNLKRHQIICSRKAKKATLNKSNESIVYDQLQSEQDIEFIVPKEEYPEQQEYHNVKRHRSTCSPKAEKTISNDSPEPTLYDQLQSEQYDEQQDLVMLEDYDPFEELLAESVNCQEQLEAEPSAKKSKQVLNCKFCNYTTDRRCNLNRHLHSCKSSEELLAKSANYQKQLEAEPSAKKAKQPSANKQVLKCKFCNYTTDRRCNLNRHLHSCKSTPPIRRPVVIRLDTSE